MSWDPLPERLGLERERQVWEAAHGSSAFPQQERLDQLRRRSERDDAWISAGGPLLNMGLGTLGFLWLLLLAPEARAGWRGWSATLAALCWSRQPFNLALHGLRPQPAGGYMADEVRLALELGWQPWSLLVITGVLGLEVCAGVIALQPPERRWHVLVGGPLSCLLGFALWYGWLGPALLPPVPLPG